MGAKDSNRLKVESRKLDSIAPYEGNPRRTSQWSPIAGSLVLLRINEPWNDDACGSAHGVIFGTPVPDVLRTIPRVAPATELVSLAVGVAISIGRSAAKRRSNDDLLEGLVEWLQQMLAQPLARRERQKRIRRNVGDTVDC